MSFHVNLGECRCLKFRAVVFLAKGAAGEGRLRRGEAVYGLQKAYKG